MYTKNLIFVCPSVKMYLSVVIPAHNAGQSLERCVTSVSAALKAFPREAEILVVDDGSTDGTRELAVSLSARFPQLRVFSQANGGVSSARNAGLAQAQGKWVSFIDDDDTVFEDVFSRLQASLPAFEDADILILRSFLEEKERYAWHPSFRAKEYYSREQLMQKGYLRGSICGCLFQRSFLAENALRFPLGIRLSEDTVFFGACLSKARRTGFLDIPFYRITPRPGSASRQRRAEDLEAILQAVRAAREQISDPAVRNYTTFKLLINYTSRAADAGVQARQAGKALQGILPLSPDGIHTERWKMALLNGSYPLFYRLIGLRNRMAR